MKLLSLILLLLASTPVFAAQKGILFTGKLVWTKLIPHGSNSSNACGVSITKFKADKILWGPTLSEIEIHNTMGEFCQPPQGTAPTRRFISAIFDNGKWYGVLSEVINYSPKSYRSFVNPRFDGILFGCSTELWKKIIPEDIKYNNQKLEQVRFDIKRGHLRVYDDVVYLNKVIYIDEVSKNASNSACLVNGGEGFFE